MDFKLFLPLFILLSHLSLFNNGIEASHQIFPEYETLRSVNKVEQLHRTAFHFQPVMNFINDPNGPMYYKGLYHFFYQYNPQGPLWGISVVWGHSVSKDMISWESLEPAICPSEPYDINGAWSGSATILPGNKPVILYTGIDLHRKQVQNYAIPANSSDPYLKKWVKPGNNPIAVPGEGINATAFRDPTTAWFSNNHWKMVVGGKRKRRGMAILYLSKDFVNWVKAKHPLHSGSGTGMWECPDFYPVLLSGKTGVDTSISGENVKHVFKVSLDETRSDHYTVGTYFPEKHTYIPDVTSIDGFHGLRYDYGNFYASKTFFDSEMNRRVLWGWANESDSPRDGFLKGWGGIQAIPRIVWLDKTQKQVLQWPIQELNSLRGKNVKMRKQKLGFGEQVEVRGITAAQADVEVTFSFTGLEKAEPFDPSWVNAQEVCGQKGSKVEGGLGPFGLLTLASRNLEEFTPVFFRIFKGPNKHVVLMCSDATSSSLKEGLYKPSFAGFVDTDFTKDKKISLRTLIDHSVVESFGAGGKTCISSRVYPTLAIYGNAHLYAFNNGTETVAVENLSAWSMNRPLKMNN